jgi:phage repressor protein C with HTH and peptisase S24 domain
MSNLRDAQKQWLLDHLDARGRGARGALAIYMGVRADVITRMTNRDGSKETREISFEELVKMAEFFEDDPPGLAAARAGIAPTVARSKTALPPIGDQYGPKDFRIFSAAEGGSGEIIRSVEPVDWWPRPIEVQQVKGAYGMYIVGDSMVPEFRPGHVAVINPNLPHVGDKPYIFYAETEGGEVRATVKLLRRQTGDLWHVTQHNPPPGQKNDFTLSKKLWREAHRIVGRQDPS